MRATTALINASDYGTRQCERLRHSSMRATTALINASDYGTHQCERLRHSPMRATTALINGFCNLPRARCQHERRLRYRVRTSASQASDT
eukprot:4530381-Pyramimonas_sp.AAC.1